jgi:hypothetical protein
MGFFEKLPRHFITSAVRQVGRDGGQFNRQCIGLRQKRTR